MTFRDLFLSKMGLGQNPSGGPNVLHTATYCLELPRGWRVEETGKVAVIRGPRGELFQVSSASSLVGDASGMSQSIEVLRKTAKQSINSLLAEPDLKLLEGPAKKTTPLGFSYEEVLLRAPSGDLVAGFVVHGPRTSVIATLDAAPDQRSVDEVRQSIHSTSFDGAV